MLIEMWINENGTYGFYLVDWEYAPKHYFVLKNGEFDGIYDTLEECKEFTVDYDNEYGDSYFETGD